MTDASEIFQGLAGNYQEFRPRYPAELLGHLNDLLPAEGPLAAIDVGSGTGISTRALSETLGRRATVTGIEPSDDMRREAAEATSEDLPVRYIEGTAEDIDFDDGTVDIVFAGQAIHWFDRPKFYLEAGRVLKPGGHLAVANNNRNWRESELLSAFESFLEAHAPGYRRDYRAYDLEAELDALGWVAALSVHREAWIRPMDVDSFVGMFSSSNKAQAAIKALGEQEAFKQAREIATRHAEKDGSLPVAYVSELVVAKKS